MPDKYQLIEAVCVWFLLVVVIIFYDFQNKQKVKMEKEQSDNAPNQEMSKAVVDTMSVPDNIKGHLEAIKANPEYAQRVENISFSVDRVLFLEIKVTDKELTHLLFDWLYHNKEYFGCRLNTIHFNNPADLLKQQILEVLGEKKG